MRMPMRVSCFGSTSMAMPRQLPASAARNSACRHVARISDPTPVKRHWAPFRCDAIDTMPASIKSRTACPRVQRSSLARAGPATTIIPASRPAAIIR
ncbi:hypothetical protein G6F56_014449 [Rhizopus delemar]|nr:hypothetical protein G6F56_014449 [Rhizopus delemar]